MRRFEMELKVLDDRSVVNSSVERKIDFDENTQLIVDVESA